MRKSGSKGLKKQYWRFSTRGLSYYYAHNNKHRTSFRRRVYFEGACYDSWTDYHYSIFDVMYDMRPTTLVKKPRTKKRLKPEY